MKLSLITISYNSSLTIEDTIKSVLEQTYDNIEYLIIDGNSKDDTLSIIKKYETLFNGRLQWISEADRGLYDAMNKGIQLSSGDVIGLLNSDDFFCDNEAIHKVMQIFINNRNIDSVYADLYYVSKKDPSRIVRRWSSSKQKPFRYGWHPAHPTLYIKKEVYDKYGEFDLNFKLAADFEIMLRFLEKYRMSTYYLPEPLVKMRLGGVTNRSLKNIYNQNLECIRAFRVNGINVNMLLYIFYRIIPKLLQFKK